MKNLKAALYYANKFGYSVIPATREKQGAVAWTEFQTRKATADEIRQWWSKTPEANVAIVTGTLSNLFVVDMDTEEAKQQVDSLLPEGTTFAIARSPRGGWHYYFQHSEGIPNRANFAQGLDVRTQGGMIMAPPSVNGNGKHWSWVKGHEPWSVQPMQPPEPLLAFLKNAISLDIYNTKYLYKGNVRTLQDQTLQNLTDPTTPYNYAREGFRDEALFHAANLLVKGGGSRDEAYNILKILANSCDPPYPEKELDAKITSAIKRFQGKERSIAQEIREWVLLTKGYFNLTDAYMDLQILTKLEKNAVYVAMNRLQAEGIIEKYGDKRGCFRLIEKSDDEMEFVEGEVQEFNVKLPFDLNDLCSLYAKNIIVIAGSKGSGKTAFLMNLALTNKDVVYLNSEMGPDEWSGRLKAHGIQKKADVLFTAKQCHANFHDKITGEKKIFIVDYMEIHDNFYEVAKHIRLIHEKLQEGICFIALQKKTDAYLGRGSEFSLEKARLYLTLDYMPEAKYTKVTIVDAKSPKREGGVRGFFRHVKITSKGSRLSPVDNWRG